MLWSRVERLVLRSQTWRSSQKWLTGVQGLYTPLVPLVASQLPRSVIVVTVVVLSPMLASHVVPRTWRAEGYTEGREDTFTLTEEKETLAQIPEMQHDVRVKERRRSTKGKDGAETG